MHALNNQGVAYIQIQSYKNGYLFEAQRHLELSQPYSLETYFLPKHEVLKY